MDDLVAVARQLEGMGSDEFPVPKPETSVKTSMMQRESKVGGQSGKHSDKSNKSVSPIRVQVALSAAMTGVEQRLVQLLFGEKPVTHRQACELYLELSLLRELLRSLKRQSRELPEALNLLESVLESVQDADTQRVYLSSGDSEKRQGCFARYVRHMKSVGTALGCLSQEVMARMVILSREWKSEQAISDKTMIETAQVLRAVHIAIEEQAPSDCQTVIDDLIYHLLA